MAIIEHRNKKNNIFFSFQREKRRIIREEERKARREKRRKDRQKKIDRGLIDPEKEPEEPDSEEEPDPEEGVPLFIPETYKINSGFYSMDGTKFWLTMVSKTYQIHIFFRKKGLVFMLSI